MVIAHPREVDAWAGDLFSFSGVRPILFPAWDDQPSPGHAVDEIAGQRLRLLKQFDSGDAPHLVLTTIQALLQPVPGRADFAARRRILDRGATADLEELAVWLVENGYQNTDAVELPGEFSRRGGILDVYSPDAEAPHRLEFFGDEIDAIRSFSPQTQRSLGDLERAEWATIGQRNERQESSEKGHLSDYLPAGAWVVLVETADLQQQGRHYLDRISDAKGLFSVADVFAKLVRLPSVTVSALPSPSVETTFRLHVESVERFSGDVSKVRDELDAVAARERVLIACQNDGECKRLSEVLASGRLAQTDRLRLVVGRVRAPASAW